jgi:hypothetical protein
MFVTYFYGCYWLPVLLTWLDFDAARLGKVGFPSTVDFPTGSYDKELTRSYGSGSDEDSLNSDSGYSSTEGENTKTMNSTLPPIEEHLEMHSDGLRRFSI